MQNGLVPLPHVVDKNLGGISQEQGVQLHTRFPSPGFQCQEGKPPQLPAAKTSRDWVSRRNCWSPKQILLKNPQVDSPTQTHSLWAPAMGWWLEGHELYTGRGWHQGGQRPLSLFWALPPQNWQIASKIPLTWLTLTTCLGDPRRLCPTQLMGPPRLLFHE